MKSYLFIFTMLFFVSCSTVKHTGLSSKTYSTKSGWKLPYNIYFPKSYKEGNIPVILWLHGASERGVDNVSQLIHIVPYLASDIVQTRFSCIIIAPQCPKEDYWAPVKRFEWRVINDGKTTPAMTGVIELLDYILKDPKIDKSRIYVGGLSMGGFGTLDLLHRRPELLAAAVPICGGADLEKAGKFKDVPLWIFHGAKDTVVPADLSRELIKVLNEMGSTPKYTEYPEGGHGIWNDAIRDPELLPWLFSQKKVLKNQKSFKN